MQSTIIITPTCLKYLLLSRVEEIKIAQSEQFDIKQRSFGWFGDTEKQEMRFQLQSGGEGGDHKTTHDHVHFHNKQASNDKRQTSNDRQTSNE